MNGAAVIVAVLLSFILAGVPLLYGAIIGLLAGCIAGLKMSFGESVGPWKKLDSYFNVNRSHREASASGKGRGAPSPQEGRGGGPRFDIGRPRPLQEER